MATIAGTRNVVAKLAAAGTADLVTLSGVAGGRNVVVTNHGAGPLVVRTDGAAPVAPSTTVQEAIALAVGETRVLPLPVPQLASNEVCRVIGDGTNTPTYSVELA